MWLRIAWVLRLILREVGHVAAAGPLREPQPRPASFSTNSTDLNQSSGIANWTELAVAEGNELLSSQASGSDWKDRHRRLRKPHASASPQTPFKFGAQHMRSLYGRFNCSTAGATSQPGCRDRRRRGRHEPWPTLPPGITWGMKHPKAETIVKQASVALCLFGIPATRGKKAGYMQLDVAGVKPVLKQQLQHLPPVDVYSHAWVEGERNLAKKSCREIIRVYQKEGVYRSEAFRCEHIIWKTSTKNDEINGLYGYNHVRSMILSMNKVLELVNSSQYDRIILARHDMILCEKVPIFAPGQFVVLGSWGSHKQIKGNDVDGVPDYAFIGDPSSLKFVFATLNGRFARQEEIHPLMVAHLMIQQHLDELNITARSYPLRRFLYRHNISRPNVCTSSLPSAGDQHEWEREVWAR